MRPVIILKERVRIADNTENTQKVSLPEWLNAEKRFSFNSSPEIFGSSRIKIERPAAYLVSCYNSVSSSLRDSFTAGGRVNIKFNGNTVGVSRLIYNLFHRSKNIQHLFKDIPCETLSEYWRLKIEGNPIDIWLTLISKHNTENINISELFKEGLKKWKS